MGYDVTFHPVAIADLERLVFDVVRTPTLAAARAKEASAKKAKAVADIYGHFPAWLDDDDAEVNATFAFAAAAVAGFRHPYWYARGSAMSFLPKLPVKLVPMNELAGGLFAKQPGAKEPRIGNNYTASGVVMPDQLDALASWLGASKNKKAIDKVFDDDGLDSLRRAIAYARSCGLGLMEAADLVVPMANEGATDLDNLRAHFLKRLEPGDGPKKKKKAKTTPNKKAAKARRAR